MTEQSCAVEMGKIMDIVLEYIADETRGKSVKLNGPRRSGRGSGPQLLID